VAVNREYRPIPRTVELAETARMAINSSVASAHAELSDQLAEVRKECLQESRDTLAEVRSIREAIIETTSQGWTAVIDAIRKPNTIPSPPPANDALHALGVMRQRQPTLSEIVLAVDENQLKRDGDAVQNFKKTVRKGMHEGVRKAIAWTIAGIVIWLLRDLLPHARILPNNVTAEPTMAPAGK
jgi:hypothetical protein